MPPSPALTSRSPAPPPPWPFSRGGGAAQNVGGKPANPHFLLAATLATLALAAATLRLAPPTIAGFYPRCPIHQYTGLLCPGCGATRALAALAHGRIFEALHWNPLVTLLLPCAAAYGLLLYVRAVRHPGTRARPIPVSVIAALLAVTALFTLIRNLS